MERVFHFETEPGITKPGIQLRLINYLTDSVNLMIVQEKPQSQSSWSAPTRTTYLVEASDKPAEQFIDALRHRIVGPVEEQSWSMLPLVVSHLLVMGP